MSDPTSNPRDTDELRNKLAVRQQSTEVVDTAPSSSYLPSASEWNTMSQMAAVLSKSQLVPKQYRGAPENIILATMAGRQWGWDPSMSMRSFHIIEGTPSLKPEIMLALVRKAGHKVSGEATPTGATVTGERRDTGETMTVTFTIEQAKTAQLLSKDNWRHYPADMCWARAMSALCRRLFGDVVLGSGYTPDELVEGIEGGVIDVQPYEDPDLARRAQLKARARELPDAVRTQFATWFEANALSYKNAAHLAIIEAKLVELEVEQRDGEVVDAEVVEGEPGKVIDVDTGEVIDNGLRTDAQLKKLFAAIKPMGMRNNAERHAWASKILGRAVQTFNDLTAREASFLIDLAEQVADSPAEGADQ